MTAERVFLSAPDVGPAERDALLRAFDSGWIAPAGPELAAFESEISDIMGWPGTVALSSGTAALHLALVTLGVGAGDDVLVPTATFVATANAVGYVGARPCFVDSETESWNLSADLLAAELSERAARGRLPAAVIVVDLYGQCADYDRIVPICAEYDIPIVEDAAEALGSTHQGRPAGTLGDVGVFSFNGNKIVTTSGGGALVTRSTAVADRVRHLSTQAQTGVRHFEHDEPAFNYRLSNLLAAMGRAQLGRLSEMSNRRLSINDRYRTEFARFGDMVPMPVASWGEWNGWLSCFVLSETEQRDEIMAALDDADIESRCLWNPMHRQAPYRDAPARLDGTSERLFAHGLCLPSGSGLSDAQVDRVVDVVGGVLDGR